MDIFYPAGNQLLPVLTEEGRLPIRPLVEYFGTRWWVLHYPDAVMWLNDGNTEMEGKTEGPEGPTMTQICRNRF